MRLQVFGKFVFCLHASHPSRSLHASKYLPCISWDAKRICRLSLIFRYLLRPEMMVIYTSNIIYGFSTKSHTSQGGIHARIEIYAIQQYHAKPTEGKGGIHAKPSQSSISRQELESKGPPLPNRPNQSICRETLSILYNRNTHSQSWSPISSVLMNLVYRGQIRIKGTFTNPAFLTQITKVKQHC